jgi:peptidylprolyl isomerase
MAHRSILIVVVALMISGGCGEGGLGAISCGIGSPGGGTIPAPPDVAAPPSDSLKTTSGLSIKVLEKGSGTRHPQPADRVVVHYTGWTTDGKMFDSSVTRGEPATFGVTDVIAGWTEALQRMVEGEKVRVWIPENLAYGGVPGKPAGMLVFDVELIRIN